MVITGGAATASSVNANGPLVDVGSSIHGAARQAAAVLLSEPACATAEVAAETGRGTAACAAAAVAQLVVCRSRHLHSELERDGATNLGLILSAFEQLKTGRRVEYQVHTSHRPALDDHSDTKSLVSFLTVTDHSAPQITTSRSREGSEDVGSGSMGESSGSRRSRGDSLSAEARGVSRPNRDDRAAAELGLPVTADEIIGMPVEEFNSLVGGQTMALTQDQIQLMKDIRRRGKNKVAAQNCRRRKIDNMGHLDREIHNLRQELAQATARRDEAARTRQALRAVLAGGVTGQQGTTGPQRSFSGQDNPAVPLSANAQLDQPNHKRNARDTSSDPLRKRKRGA